ncbi:hypothetical protein [Desulfogranum marinum]|uniref:hypothetical protein n=1 Tax=Desulfogranum marinum TaxID=453220 RepID=UPI001963FCD4|nr:hypothetical protein [Desulfogranum marinum]MBM9511786.1 hypothetical protein [Desulfogranum marinum]
MKNIYVVLIGMFFATCSLAFADEPVTDAVELQQRSQTREMAQFIVDQEELPALLKAMQRQRFTHTNQVQVQKVIQDAEQEGLPTKPLADKVYEGIAKDVDEQRIFQAMTTVRNRYAYAYRQVRQLVDDAEDTQVLGKVVAEAYTAGLQQQDYDEIVEALQTRLRTMTRQEARELALETMLTVRLMARRGVESVTVSAVVVSALEQSYDDVDMQQIQKAFTRRARNGSAQGIANQLGEHIGSGGTAQNFGRSSGFGQSPGDGAGSGGNSGGSSGNGAGSSGSSGGSGNDSSGSGGNSGGSGGSSGGGGSNGSSGGSGGSGGQGGSSGNSGGGKGRS